MQRFNDSTNYKSQIRVTGGQHGGETRHFFLAAPLFTGLFKRATAAHDFQRALAVDFFLKPAQRAFHRFAFFQFNFGQRNSHPFAERDRSARAAARKINERGA